MSCSCKFPTYWLLPCKHVLSVNIASGKGSAFLVEQCGQRWLRSFQRTPRIVDATNRVVASQVEGASSSVDDVKNGDDIGVDPDLVDVDLDAGRSQSINTSILEVQMFNASKATKVEMKAHLINIVTQLVDEVRPLHYAKLSRTATAWLGMKSKPTVLLELCEFAEALATNLEAALDPEVVSRTGKRRHRSKGELTGKNLPKQGPAAAKKPRPNP
jgi:hypothetical protein